MAKWQPLRWRREGTCEPREVKASFKDNEATSPGGITVVFPTLVYYVHDQTNTNQVFFVYFSYPLILYSY